jgi:hypothetical protein
VVQYHQVEYVVFPCVYASERFNLLAELSKGEWQFGVLSSEEIIHNHCILEERSMPNIWGIAEFLPFRFRWGNLQVTAVVEVKLYSVLLYPSDQEFGQVRGFKFSFEDCHQLLFRDGREHSACINYFRRKDFLI